MPNLNKTQQIDQKEMELQVAQIAFDDGTILSGAAMDGEVTFGDPIFLATYTVATVPTASEYEGALIYVSDGAEGTGTIAFSDGTNWLEIDGTAIDAGA